MFHNCCSVFLKSKMIFGLLILMLTFTPKTIAGSLSSISNVNVASPTIYHKNIWFVSRLLSDEDHDDHNDHKDKPWGDVIGICFLVNMTTLIGVVFLVPTILRAKLFHKDKMGSNSSNTTKDSKKVGGKFFDIVIPSFACGALMAVTVFLLIPESLLTILADHGADAHSGSDEHEEPDHKGAFWKFGTSILGGFLISVVFGSFFHDNTDNAVENNVADKVTDKDQNSDAPHSQPHHKLPLCSIVKCNMTDEKNKDNEDSPLKDISGDLEKDCIETHQENKVQKSSSLISIKDKRNWRLLISIIVGDFFHNFADGIFIGVGFMLCDKKVAHSIAFATIYHEMAQEVADFFLLTNQVGLSVPLALALNFISGLSVMFGGITVLVVKLSNTEIGVLLAIAGGVYIHIAACECVPRIEAEIKCHTGRFWNLFMIAVGAIPIGLVLMNHKHCDAH